MWSSTLNNAKVDYFSVHNLKTIITEIGKMAARQVGAEPSSPCAQAPRGSSEEQSEQPIESQLI